MEWAQCLATPRPGTLGKYSFPSDRALQTWSPEGYQRWYTGEFVVQPLPRAWPSMAVLRNLFPVQRSELCPEAVQ